MEKKYKNKSFFYEDKMKLNIQDFEKRINFKAKDKSLLLQALTHKSANEKINNEKLEFLGDRVIGLVLSKKLFDLYPRENEGILDKRFAKLVNRKTCSLLAWKIGLQNYIFTGSSKKRIIKTDEKILSDTCEALIGSIYLDQGFDFTERFVLNLWRDELKKSNITILDSKTRLQEYSLKLYKKLPIYKLLSAKGPKHNPTFKISVKIDGAKQYTGIGNSKQNAQQEAAKNLLRGINIL